MMNPKKVAKMPAPRIMPTARAEGRESLTDIRIRLAFDVVAFIIASSSFNCFILFCSLSVSFSDGPVPVKLQGHKHCSENIVNHFLNVL